jgi:nicotinamide phosphoribosyltransferase
VNIDSIAEILRTLSQFDWSAENVAFGMGGALLQKLDRDTQKMAFKCSYIEGQAEYGTGNWQSWSRDVFKQPITDPGKNSQRGRLKVVRKNTGFYTQPEALSNGDQDHLVEVFKNGDLLVDYNLASIRERAAI